MKWIIDLVTNNKDAMKNLQEPAGWVSINGTVKKIEGDVKASLNLGLGGAKVSVEDGADKYEGKLDIWVSKDNELREEVVINGKEAVEPDDVDVITRWHWPLRISLEYRLEWIADGKEKFVSVKSKKHSLI